MKVELHHISKRFGSVQANDNVSLTVEAGSIHGLLGENGAGKSTLVKILSGFITRDQGLMLLDGREVDIKTPADAMQMGIGMLHQDPLDFPPLSVLDNFMVGKPGRLFTSRQQVIKEFRRLADQFSFSLNIYQRVGDLTVGERQQVEILRLLSLGVNTLILDEPTTGISASQKDALFDAARQLASQGKSVIFVSHKLEDVNELCDRVTVMRQGQVVGDLPIPASDEQLIELIFGRELAPPVKPHTRKSGVALVLEKVTLSRGRFNIKIDHLTAHEGEVIGLAGLEGSGQQLLLQLCAGLLHASTGRLQINGVDMTHKPYPAYLNSGVGYSPADRLREGLVQGLTIHEHVALKTPPKGWFVDWKGTLKRTQEAIALFNIRGKANTKVERLSGGNQQRTQLALLPVPLNLLLMEHPTRGLDIGSTLWVWQQLIARCEGGTTILFMSSDLDEIMQYSDRVIVFSGGSVSEPIDVKELTVDRLGQMIGGKLDYDSPALEESRA
ncbi:MULTISPECIES: ATP-binding cassette domain-containing protein [unclassified Leptolyngbya]|uniref:ABC transporter ATP-binding protein n=1 Tax=unclassified Leptolyngbya TaxID=2650499 RepID=UPI001688892A|nr:MULTISPECIES: ATP-binding cassette domain-containing protein [unclassified Leptolyngbya]MBD1911735.1 ATP-binding cassette domain-containing protein [Leptolyngbya sp. FACHB-8]MBD2157334.1 ATP-binding cassette domain-containing protein [Leptolyngbya sp. FACHB-16]